MDSRYEILDLTYRFGDMEQHLFPVVLFGAEDVVLVDCGYPGSVELLEEQLRAHGIDPNTLTKLVLTHQDDDHMGSAAELKKKYPAIQILASDIEAPYLSGKRKNLRLQQGEELQSQLPDDQKAFGEQFCDRYRKLKPVFPDILLSGGNRFDWGGGCEIVVSPGHTPGHISIRALDNTFMVTGDAAVIENGQLAIANPEFCLDLKTAQVSLEKIVQYHCRQYICYHGGRK
ncbi:MAG: MBL fold metallo-hydrolase [Candidatus Heteroscillospira sp.]|jgi:glyoxylase-like metal-dependent hydrolase (beta-lactamase superfamily II)